MEGCIFCKIVAGEIPCYKIYEDDDVLAFLDINPAAPGHTLVIPKKHYLNITEANSNVYEPILSAVKKIATAFKVGLGINDYNLVVSNGKHAGQEVFHVHFHVIPRVENDGFKFWKPGGYRDNEAKEILEKLTINIEK